MAEQGIPWENLIENFEEYKKEFESIMEEVITENQKVSIGDIWTNLTFYLGKKVIVEGEVVKERAGIAEDVLCISDGTRALPIYPADLDILGAYAGANVYVGVKVRIEGEIAPGPMIIGGTQIEVEHLTVIEGDVTPPVISGVTIDGQAVTELTTTGISVTIAGKVTDDVSDPTQIRLYWMSTPVVGVKVSIAADCSFKLSGAARPGL